MTVDNPIVALKTQHTYLWLCAICLIAGIACALVIDEGHNWGDDYALYVNQAKALTEGGIDTLYEQNKFSMDYETMGPYLYPFGFPALLAPVYHVFGINLYAMKWLCALCFIGSIPIVFKLTQLVTHNRLVQLAVTTFVAFHWLFIRHSDNVLSDLPYFFFSLYAIYLIAAAKSVAGYLWLGVIMFMAYFIRDIGITLPGALFIYQITQKRPASRPAWVKTLSPYAVFMILAVGSKILLPSGGGNHLDMILDTTFTGTMSNLVYYLTKILMYMLVVKGYWVLIFAPLVIIAVYVGIQQHWRAHQYILTYILANMAILSLWPSHQGFRFVFPMLPFFTLYLFTGLNRLAEKRTIGSLKAIGLFLLLAWGVSLYQITRYARIDTNEALSIEMQQIYAYINTNMASDKVIAFDKPRTLRLFTGVNAIYYKREDMYPPADYLLAPINQQDHLPEVSLVKAFKSYELLKVN